MSVADSAVRTTKFELDLSEVQDESAFLAGFDTDTIVTEGATVAVASRDYEVKRTHATQALTLIVLTILSNVRDKAGHPVWSFASNSMPEAVSATISAIATAAGFTEDETKTVLGTNIRQALNRARESFMAAYVLENYEGAKVPRETELSTQEASNYSGALAMLPESIRAMLPEEVSESPLKPSKFNSAFKKGMAEQYSHSGLTLPEKYGGAPKDGNATGTKDKTPASVETDLVETATQAISGHVGTEGGSSYRSVAIGSLAVVSALVAELIPASKGEIKDREQVVDALLRLSDVAKIGASAIASDGKFNPDTDGKRLATRVYDPEKDGSK